MALAASAAAVTVMAIPASAAKAQVTHLRSNGTNAAAEWTTESPGKVVDTFVSATAPKKGAPELFVNRMTAQVSGQGEFLGGVQTTVHVSSGFTFTYDAKKLTKASVNGTNLPALTCPVDEFGEEVTSKCAATTVSISATWTGVGPVSKGHGTDHYSSGGFTMVVHSGGTSRDATAKASYNGKALNDFQWSSLGTYRDLKTAICRVPGGCEEGL